MVELDSNIWGPHFWFFLHTVSMNYPTSPIDGTKKRFYDFIHSIPLFIPDKDIASAFQQMLDIYPVTPYLDNRNSFTRWMHFIHNKINKRIGKPQISMDKFYEEYYNHYKPRDVKYTEYTKTKRYILYVIIVCCLIGSIVYANY